ncbi:hypothetical protein [Treponema sp. Marseille-Q3903]|uniref:hypothetical protein n=1 Tax=Treponema sp. Marseille-Q3903 TaxID=2766703 RepID=UPI0016522B24|nr:hypothetical protein [Treponema sp. Marseille-Q3903]MBC6714480.1 hypothetical protein [Treponema sp. Marseille-Q3903]
MKDKRATIFAVIFFLLTVFSIFYSAAESEHKFHCSDDFCPICYVIAVSAENLKLLRIGLGFFATLSAIFYFFIRLNLFSIAQSNTKNCTLVSQKIKLNN